MGCHAIYKDRYYYLTHQLEQFEALLLIIQYKSIYKKIATFALAFSTGLTIKTAMYNLATIFNKCGFM